MTWITKMDLNQHAVNSQGQTMAMFVVGGLVLIIICAFVWALMYKHGVFGFSPYWLVGVTCLVPAFFAFFLAIFATRDSYIAVHGFRKMKKNVLLSTHGNTVVKRKDAIYAFDDKTQKLIVVKADWQGKGESLVHGDAVIKKQQNVYHADSKIGRAFLKVGKYVTENYSKPVNLKWNVKPYKATASFDDKDGHHNVVCYVDNKNKNSGNKEIVVKY